jgi:hypothetical protein
MMALSHQQQQDQSDDFQPKSFFIACLDKDGNVGIEGSWGDSMEDVKKFATLLKRLTNGDFSDIILSQFKEQSKNVNNGNRKYTAFANIMKKKAKIEDLVISPTEVEVN